MTIKRQIYCKSSDCPHETLKFFSDWIRYKLPSSKDGFMATDMDFILYNYKSKDIVILEIKTHGKKIKEWQHIFYQNLHRWMLNGVDNGYVFHGVWLIEFEGSSFNDGKVYLNRKEISESELIRRLSFNE